MIPQGRLLAFLSVVRLGFIQLSYLWSFFSCALWFSSFYPTVANADLVIVLRVFFFILILASLSTVIDLIRNQVIPTAFGTQHVAILLVAWCPAVVFGSSPSPTLMSKVLSVSQGIFLVSAIRSYLSTAVLSAFVLTNYMYTFLYTYLVLF